MRYTNVHIDAIGYHLPPVVVTSSELEARLTSVYSLLHIPLGQLESMTGILERRWWEEGYSLSQGAAAAGKKALEQAGIHGEEIEALIYAGVCREQFEPATACRVALELGVHPSAAVYDLSNACLGVLNGMIEIANRIELGQIRAGLVVTCETARDIVDNIIKKMIQYPTLELFRESFATLTGGSGAAAVLLSDGSFANTRRRLLGGVTQTAPEHHDLCRWGVEQANGHLDEFMRTDSTGVLKHGVVLGTETWHAFCGQLGWTTEVVDKVICHQVGVAHQETILETLNIAPEKDFSTFSHLGNVGTASLPMTAAIAEERGVLQPADRVAWLGIGSGLNCLMLGFEW
ncbi:MAG: 3-oxoacyl-ACP synthase III [Gemmataceae bacterium]